jgi:two-component system, cell cycle response regulator
MHWVLRWDMALGSQELVSALFRETDRAQRMKTPLALIKIGMIVSEDSRSVPDGAALDTELQEVIRRITLLLRCYDTVGRMSDREILLVLPGGNISDARRLAERLRDEIFDTASDGSVTDRPFHACYGIASSGGRSPFVVIREVDGALRSASAEGTGSIRCVAPKAETDPAVFFLPIPQDEVLPGQERP